MVIGLKVEVKGRITGNNEVLWDLISEVFEKYMQKLKEDSPDAAQQLDDNCEDIVITELSATLGFKMRGQDELVTMTVNPLGADHPELLVVTAETDEHGNLLWETVKDNENESQFSEIEAKIAEGLPTDFTEIESRYSDYELQLVKTFEIGDYLINVSVKSLQEDDTTIAQYIKEDKLIQEVEFLPENGKTLSDVLAHFEQLIA